ncbi:MAG: hypothetical protein RL141_451 [Candidatus Parcubacteria bacterium]
MNQRFEITPALLFGERAAFLKRDHIANLGQTLRVVHKECSGNRVHLSVLRVCHATVDANGRRFAHGRGNDRAAQLALVGVGGSRHTEEDSVVFLPF